MTKPNVDGPQPDPVEPWYQAVCGIPNAVERLRMALRVLKKGFHVEAAIYANGTGVARIKGSPWSLDEILSRYDLPNDGESMPAGRVLFTHLGDGSVFFPWEAAWQEGEDLGGGAFSMATKEEIVLISGWSESRRPGEPMDGADLIASRYGMAGLVYRSRRTQDARNLKMAAHWKAGEK